MTHLEQLPERGWGVLRDVPAHLVVAYWGAGLIKAQKTGNKDVWMARLTGPGRQWVKEQS